jgi:hypothetical protein
MRRHLVLGAEVDDYRARGPQNEKGGRQRRSPKANAWVPRRSFLPFPFLWTNVSLTLSE